MPIHKNLCCLASILALLALATQATAAPAQPALDRSVLPLPQARFVGKVGRYPAESDRPMFPAQPGAPKGAPNVVLVLLDDVGFGQTSTFGGAIETPSLDRLSQQGLRFNQFHTTGLCSPTRAALLTGRNHHSVGSGKITEMASGYDGYNSMMGRDAASIAQVLRHNGYATAMFGKHHNTPDWETTAAGPFDRWPTGMGFEYFYGFLGGETSQFEPTLYENTRPVAEQPRPADYHLSSDLASRAIDWVQQLKSVAPDKPYFLYLAPGATHAPHHAPREWIDRFKGRFDAGWDEYRRLTLERQKQMGMVPADTQLTPRPEGIPAWDSLSAEQKRVAARMMEVFAGFTAHVDHEMGRVVEAVRSLPDGDNTLVLYVVGDNGGSAEGGPMGTLNAFTLYNGMRDDNAELLAHLDELGSARHNNHFPYGWAWAMNTPFPWYKMVPSHLGAIRNGLVVSWPQRFSGQGQVRSQFHHVVDIVPTILEAAGLPAPKRVDGVEQKPMAGVSMAYAFDQADAPSRHRTQYFEIQGNRAIYHDGWLASAKFYAISDFFTGREPLTDPSLVKWELYDLKRDFSQSRDLAAREPARLKAMESRFWAEMRTHGALPVTGVNTVEDMTGVYRPSYTRGRTRFAYPSGAQLPEINGPSIKNRSFRIDADVKLQPGSEGVLVAEGGRTGGYSLFIKGGRLHFVYNFLDKSHYQISSLETLPAQVRTLSAAFAYDGGGAGKGGVLTLLADGKKLAEGRIDHTLPARFAFTESFDVGLDSGSPVSDAYAAPYRFSGRLDQLRVELMP
ncbi:arylsulfatase [Denitratisoma oestradiolicum]|uniref:Sulfatase n=1 Tax=Denitratisoma oestradiolicum TaxID=311182 RepID=A0A6S6XXH8_9PROT|nr:arylsulfatase [Denitratisoma oestradiolicum]TWO80493.1 arylsulfatase [Denitratisoma oestradiolicum]CAB1367559.1 Sulfatase [Denitratisoma oestradiolicum]